MPLLLVCVVLFFGIAQFYQWSSGLTLPFPVLLLAGAGLAVLSNLKQRYSTPEITTPEITAPEITAAADLQSVSIPLNQTASSGAMLPPDIRPAVDPRPETEPRLAEPQLPAFAPPAVAPPLRSISFRLNPAPPHRDSNSAAP